MPEVAAIGQELKLRARHGGLEVNIRVHFAVGVERNHDEIVRRVEDAGPVQRVEAGADTLQHFAGGAVIVPPPLSHVQENGIELVIQRAALAKKLQAAGARLPAAHRRPNVVIRIRGVFGAQSQTRLFVEQTQRRRRTADIRLGAGELQQKRVESVRQLCGADCFRNLGHEQFLGLSQQGPERETPGKAHWRLNSPWSPCAGS